MDRSLQLPISFADKEQLKRTWAFATKRRGSIMACSYQARLFGIRVGMRIEDARAMVPQLKILVIGGGNV